MITETIYEHLKDIYNSKVGPLVSPAIEIDPSFTVSRVIHDITKNDVYDVFCMEGDHVLTTNVRTLLGGKDIADMNIRPFLSPIHSLTKDDLVQKAANTIAHYRIRAVPVLENNKIERTPGHCSKANDIKKNRPPPSNRQKLGMTGFDFISCTSNTKSTRKTWKKIS